MTDAALLTGADQQFGLGSTVELGGIKLKVRAPTMAEIGLYTELSNKHNLSSIVDSATAVMGSGTVSIEAENLIKERNDLLQEIERIRNKEKRLKSDADKILRLSKQLDDYEHQTAVALAKSKREKYHLSQRVELAQQIAKLEAKTSLSDAERQRLNELFTQDEENEKALRDVTIRQQKEVLESIDSMYKTADRVNIELTYHFAKQEGYDGTLEEWRLNVLNQGQVMESLVVAMGFDSPLSSISRRQTALSGMKSSQKRMQRDVRLPN